MKCLDFEIKIGTPDGRNVPVSVLGSPAGEGAVAMTFPYDSLALENRLQSLQLALLAGGPTRRRLIPEHEQAVQRFGSEMFEALFAGDVRSLFDRSRQEAIRQGADLRIQLRFDSADMASLPWEFLYDSRRAEYLCLSTSTPIVRYVELADPQEPLTVAPPLRLLAMAASPSDLPALDVAQERARMEAALGQLDDRFELHWVEGQTWRDLHSALRQGPWHIFHFVGHGGFDTNLGEGVIALTADGGGTHRLCATDLGRLLGDHHPLRLAVLNACDGARADRMDVFSSTASVLVRRGTPAVVAMQYEITDTAAVELSRAFYGALASGLPVDEALGEARKSVALAVPGTLEWGTPVLYLRAPDGRIFDIDSHAASPPPPLPPAPPAPTPQPEAALEPNAPVVATPTAPAPSAPGAADDTGTKRRRPLILAGACLAAVLAIVVLAVVLTRDGKATGTGTFNLALDDEGGYVTHTVEVPKNSILLVEVDPSEEFDPDVAASTDAARARALAVYLKGAGFDRSRFRGLFDNYGYGPPGSVLVARVDEGGPGDRERLLVMAPKGGRFDIVVGGAAGTQGGFDLGVTAVDFHADRDGSVYIDDLLDNTQVRRFLSEQARSDLDDWGSVAVPAGDVDEGATDGDPLVLTTSVPATVAWTDAGADIYPGYNILITAEGKVYDDVPGNPDRTFGPDGQEDVNQEHTGDPFPKFNHAVLMGRIGEDGEPFVIGSETEVTADEEGRLFLGINDGFYEDNAGSFDVVINIS